jgi:acyl-CoA thioester hydrolase
MAEAAPQDRPSPLAREDFVYFDRLSLRYADNDANGHVNNAHYYSFFDTAVEGFLRENQLRELLAGPIMTPVVASSCRYFKEISFPGEIMLGVRIGRIGRTSITYEIAIFASSNEQSAAAQGTFTIVCTDRTTRRPVPVPDSVLKWQARTGG